MIYICLLLTFIAVSLLTAALLATFVLHRQPRKVFLDPGQFGLDFVDASFETADGINLIGWWIPAPGSARTIICLHGYAGSCDSRSIGLLGFSMGGRVALLTAARHPQAVSAVISDCAPARLTTAFAANLREKHLPGFLAAALAYIIVTGMCLRTGRNLFLQEPYHQIYRLAPLPILFIQGGRDLHIRRDELDHMVRKAGENVECWVVPQAGHRNLEDFVGVEYIERVIAFFQRSL